MSTTQAGEDDGLEPTAAGTRDGRPGAAGGPGVGAPGAEKANNCKRFAATPPFPRVQLDSLQRVRREMAQLYAEGKHGQRAVQDAARLANILALIARIIENGEMERRLTELEKLAAGRAR